MSPLEACADLAQPDPRMAAEAELSIVRSVNRAQLVAEHGLGDQPWILLKIGGSSDAARSPARACAAHSRPYAELEHVGMDTSSACSALDHRRGHLRDFERLDDLGRVLKPRGRLLLSVPFGRPNFRRTQETP